jgi:hypothetical protein
MDEYQLSTLPCDIRDIQNEIERKKTSGKTEKASEFCVCGMGKRFGEDVMGGDPLISKGVVDSSTTAGEEKWEIEVFGAGV